MSESTTTAKAKEAPAAGDHYAIVEASGTQFWLQPNRSSDNWAVFAQGTYAFNDKLHLTLGLRLDDYNDFGNSLNPRGAMIYQATPKGT